MNQKSTQIRTMVLALLAGTAMFASTASPAAAQASTTAVPSSNPVALPSGAGGLAPGANPGGSTGGSTTTSNSRTRAVVHFNWFDTGTVVVPRRQQVGGLRHAPRAQRLTTTTYLPFTAVPTSPTGLSTAMPNWKIATTVLPTTLPATGHTTYAPPPVVNTYDVVVPRRRFSYGISLVRTN